MVKGPNKKTSLSKLKEKKVLQMKKKTLHVTSFFKKKAKDKFKLLTCHLDHVI